MHCSERPPQCPALAPISEKVLRPDRARMAPPTRRFHKCAETPHRTLCRSSHTQPVSQPIWHLHSQEKLERSKIIVRFRVHSILMSEKHFKTFKGISVKIAPRRRPSSHRCATTLGLKSCRSRSTGTSGPSPCTRP